jgi:hypothetical protein
MGISGFKNLPILWSALQPSSGRSAVYACHVHSWSVEPIRHRPATCAANCGHNCGQQAHIVRKWYLRDRPSAQINWAFRGASGRIRTLDLLFTNLWVGNTSESISIHGCRIFQGFSLRRFDSDPRLCIVIYPHGCQFGCHSYHSLCAQGRSSVRRDFT